MVIEGGRECKRYQERVAGKARHCVPKPTQCPYVGCNGHHIWYHGWYHRKAENLPTEEGQVAGLVAIRRFKCCTCHRTFSWRPPFLGFRQRYLVATYVAFLEGVRRRRRGGEWWQPSAGAIQTLQRRLRVAAQGLVKRLEEYLKLPLSKGDTLADVFRLARDVARQASTPDHPRTFCHILFLALATFRSPSLYALTAT